MAVAQPVSLPLLRGSLEGAHCEACPFAVEGQPFKPVLSEHPANPSWILIGEGPGMTEVNLRRPFCFVPKTLVLMADLTWKPIGDVAIGDRVLSLDEFSPEGPGASGRGARRWHVSEVTATHRRKGEAIEVITDRGALRGSADHPVLVRHGGRGNGSSGATKWLELGKTQTAERAGRQARGNGELATGRCSRIMFLAEPWAQRVDYDAAWLAGFLDGEGHVLGSRPDLQRGERQLKRNCRVGFSQNEGPVFDEAARHVAALGYELNAREKSRHKGKICLRANVKGTLADAMRFLGEIRPGRLIRDFQVAIENKGARGLGEARVLSRHDIGEHELIDITTTSGTFIANGFVVHNCGPSGEVVNKVLTRIGKARNEIYVGNATLCIPPRGSPDHQRDQAAKCCRPRLRRELAQFPGVPVLTLGAVAARALIPQETLDAIDPPSVPKSKKRSQKERQRAIAKELARETKNRVKGIDKIFKRRVKELVKHEHERLIKQCMTPHPGQPWQKRKKPTIRQLEAMLTDERIRPKLEDKARKDAIAEWNLGATEREMQAQYEAANPKPKKPPKPKKVKITDIMGSCFTVDVDGTGPRPLIPTIHPAALLRGGGATIGGTHTPDLAFINLIYDAGKVHALGQGKNIHLRLNIETEIEDSQRTGELLRDIVLEAIEEGEAALDLETFVEDPERHHALMAYVANIRALGIATSKRSISILWGLIPSWAFSYLQVLLAHHAVIKTFHNGIYDRTVFEANGFTVAGPWADTLLAHHAAFPGCAHRLQVVTTQFFAVEPWKCLRGDVAVLLPDRSTVSIKEFVRKRLPSVLSLEDGEIREKRVVGWHDVSVPGQEWLAVKTERCDRKYTRGLIVTPDHRVMTQRGLVEAQALSVGQDRIAIDEPAFSEDQIAVALGALLGDSILAVSRVFHKTPWLAKRASVRGGHANEGYRDYKVQSLALGTTGMTLPEHDKMICGVPTHAADFFHYGTKWAFQYMTLASLVYDEAWRRRIKLECLRRLGRRGLATMFMDNGDFRFVKRCAQAGFATNGFQHEDVELFAQWLCETYGRASARADGYCALSTDATKNMLEDLRGYIHPSMAYKTPYADAFKPVALGRGAYHVAITAVEPVERHSSELFDRRYCLSVEDTKLFFTNYGLVSNSEFRNAEETPQGLTTYNAKDTGSTHALRPRLEILVRQTKTEKIYELDKKMAEIASRMHLVGMPVKREVNEELLQTFSKNVADSRRAVEEVAADPKIRDQIWHFLCVSQSLKQRKADSANQEERYKQRLEEIRLDTKWRWKIGGGQHVAALIQALGVPLLQVTETGQVTTKKEILESLVHVPVVRDILSFRENDKLLSTFIWAIFDRYDSFGELIQHGYADHEDRIHPIWVVHKISGRWASSEPVVSNVPKDKFKKLPDGTKQLIRPNLRRQISPTRKGRILVGFDFSQLEARVIALVSGDPFLCSVFAEGKDIHRECARVVFPNFDSLDKDSQKKARDETKNFEYGAFYGGAPETLWKTLLKQGYNYKLADVAKAQAVLMHRMAGVVAWQRACVVRAMQPPYEVRDFLLGRRRTFPMGQVEATEAMNSEIQPSAASIMNTGMARMDAALVKFKEADTIAQIHDAAVFEVWEDDAEAIAAEATRCFTQSYERDGRTIPFPIEVKIGHSWADV